MSPKIPPFPPREFATIDEVLAGSSIGSADREEGTSRSAEPIELPARPSAIVANSSGGNGGIFGAMGGP